MEPVYEIVLHAHAERELDKVPDAEFPRIDKQISALAQNPRPFGSKKLGGHLHRVRVKDWRVVYGVIDKEKRVVILRVVRRNEGTHK